MELNDKTSVVLSTGNGNTKSRSPFFIRRPLEIFNSWDLIKVRLDIFLFINMNSIYSHKYYVMISTL